MSRSRRVRGSKAARLFGSAAAAKQRCAVPAAWATAGWCPALPPRKSPMESSQSARMPPKPAAPCLKIITGFCCRFISPVAPTKPMGRQRNLFGRVLSYRRLISRRWADQNRCGRGSGSTSRPAQPNLSCVHADHLSNGASKLKFSHAKWSTLCRPPTENRELYFSRRQAARKPQISMIGGRASLPYTSKQAMDRS